MSNFTRIGPKTKKLWLSIIPALRQSYQPRLGQPQKRCEPQLFLAALEQAIRCSKALDLGSLNLQFEHDWQKNEKITALLLFLPENLEKCRSTELYCTPLEGSTVFLCGSSTCRMSMESYQLADFKYAFSEEQAVRLKNYRPPLESSQLGELKYAISPG